MVSTYCKSVKEEVSRNTKYAPLHQVHHDTIHGFFPANDRECFKRLIMEINEAGLNWGLILSKEKTMIKAYSKFDYKIVAHYTEKKIKELLNNPGIIRSEKKIRAAVHNAQSFNVLVKQNGTFRKWIIANHTLSLNQWVQLFKQHFTFVGPSVVSEYLISLGVLKGAHHSKCPYYRPANQSFLNALKSVEKI